jgi:hypothetical protein
MSTKAVQRVGRVVEHAPEFELFHIGGQLGGFALDREQAGFVAFFLAHVIEFDVVGELAGELGQSDHHAVESLLFLAQFLGAFRVVPDRGVLEPGVDGSQALRFGIEVKDTPGGLRSWRSGP